MAPRDAINVARDEVFYAFCCRSEKILVASEKD
jgi:hypothetical protein